MEACDLCGKVRHFSPDEINRALEEHYKKYPDSDWEYFDEIYSREQLYCGDCPYLFEEEE